MATQLLDDPVRLFVIIDRPAYERLRALAVKERRRPNDQASVLLERALDGAVIEGQYTELQSHPAEHR